MAFLAGDQQVFFYLYPFLRIVRTGDVVNSMTVVADRHIHLLVRVLLLEQSDGSPMKISHVRIEHLGREAIFLHAR